MLFWRCSSLILLQVDIKSDQGRREGTVVHGQGKVILAVASWTQITSSSQTSTWSRWMWGEANANQLDLTTGSDQ